MPETKARVLERLGNTCDALCRVRKDAEALSEAQAIPDAEPAPRPQVDVTRPGLPGIQPKR